MKVCHEGSDECVEVRERVKFIDDSSRYYVLLVVLHISTLSQSLAFRTSASSSEHVER
jgi:hypothetical protein